MALRKSPYLVSLAILPLLSACGGATTGGKVRSTSVATPPKPALTAPQQVRPPMRYRPRNPQVQAQLLATPGLEGVMGVTAVELTSRLGTARLDVWEGDARKLQFSNPACVLDIYLYPEAQGREPESAYVEARRSSDGQDVDRAACIAAFRKR